MTIMKRTKTHKILVVRFAIHPDRYLCSIWAPWGPDAFMGYLITSGTGMRWVFSASDCCFWSRRNALRQCNNYFKSLDKKILRHKHNTYWCVNQ